MGFQVNYNVPTYEKRNLTFGQARVFLGPPGETPTKDVGATDGNVELTFTKETLEVWQGSPSVLIAQYITLQGATLRFTAMEGMARLDLLRYALGAGDYTGTEGVGTEILDYGGNANLAEVAARVFHRMPNGTCVFFYVWRAQSQADSTLSFNKTGMSGLPIELKVLDGEYDFTGAALSTTNKGRLFRVIKINAPV